jgi:hypothetical protein
MQNPWEDCEQTRLPFYRPFDAAVRWCGLTATENEIAQGVSETWQIKKGEWLGYPCLAVHSDAIIYAMQSGALRYGRDGKQVAEDDTVARNRRTVAHSDLKEWLRKEYPRDVQKTHMAWLFDDVERSIHPAITTEAYDALNARNKELEIKLANATKNNGSGLDARERATLLCIIGVLAKEARVDLSQPMKAGEAIAAMIPSIKINPRTIGEHLSRVDAAMDSRTS